MHRVRRTEQGFEGRVSPGLRAERAPGGERARASQQAQASKLHRARRAEHRSDGRRLRLFGARNVLVEVSACARPVCAPSSARRRARLAEAGGRRHIVLAPGKMERWKA